MKAKVEIKLETRDMYDFLMKHTYTSFSGISGILLGIIMFVLFFWTIGSVEMYKSMLYLLFGFLCLFYMPLNLYSRAKKQIERNDTLNNPIVYDFSEDGITLMQGEEEGTVTWEQVVRVRSTKRCLFIYTSSIHACILPKEKLGQQYDTICQMLQTHIDKSLVRVK